MAKRSRIAAVIVALAVLVVLALVGQSDAGAARLSIETSEWSDAVVASSSANEAPEESPVRADPKLTEEQAQQLLDNTNYEPDAVLLGVSGGLSAKDIRAQIAELEGLEVKSVAFLSNDAVRVSLHAESQSLAKVMSEISAFDFVQSVQPNYVYVQVDNTSPTEAKAVKTSESDEKSFTEDTYANLQWNLQSVNVLPAWEEGITGKGVSVAVIDAGFDAEHPDLVGKYVGAYVVDDGSARVGSSGHGLEVSGVITANQDNGYATSGVAPGAKVVPITIPKGGYTSAGIIQAYAYILRARDTYNIRVVNMSFGFDWSKPAQGDVLVYQMIDEAYAAGVVPVASAGNNGSTVNHCPCDYGTTVGVMGLEYQGFDAKTYDKFDESKVVRSESSNYNDAGQTSKGIIAPGFIVPNISLGDRDNNYGLSWGTSFAAPHVCAALALVFEANPDLTPSQAISILYSTARDMGDTGWDAYHGYGRLDVGAAVAAAKDGAWLQGPRYMAVGESAEFVDGNGSGIGELEDGNSVGDATIQGGVGTVVPAKSGVMQLRAKTTSGVGLCTEVNAVGPIEGPDELAREATATYTVDQPYPFVYVWRVDDSEPIAISSTFSYAPGSGGEHTITATLVADPSVVLSKVVAVDEFVPGPVLFEASGVDKSGRVESFTMDLGEHPYEGGIEYRACTKEHGWDSAWAADGAVCGAGDKTDWLGAIQVKLTNQMAGHYDVWYRVQVNSYGWLGWAKNGERAGTIGASKPIEAVEVCLCVKGQTPDGVAEDADDLTVEPYVA